jgi:hypothetical protein
MRRRSPAYPSGHASFGAVALLLAQSLLKVDDNFSRSFVSDQAHRGASAVWVREPRRAAAQLLAPPGQEAAH